MAKTKQRYQALKLRKEGKSLKEIADKLKVSKSTVSVWCRDIELTPSQIEKLVKKQESASYKGRLKFLERVRRERKEQTLRLKKEGIREVSRVNRRDLFIGGIAMYVSEGVTSSSKEEVSFSNSSPQMILFMLRWFGEVCGVENDRFVIQIRINELHKKRAREIEKYWSDITGIPISQFTKTILIKTNLRKVYPNPNQYHGTIRLGVHRATQLRRKINGWIEGLLNLPV